MTVRYFKTWDDAHKCIEKNGLSVVDFGMNDDDKGKYYVTVWGTRKD